MSLILSSVACNLDNDILTSCLPLFESEKVGAIEWSFDTLFNIETIPEWFSALLTAYSETGRLIGHGVFFSLFTGRWLREQEDWLLRLRKLSTQFQFNHITEHFGFMTGTDFHKGAPISIPCTSSTLAIGIDRLKRIQDACNCPVGLENLAFAYSTDEVKKHGDFLFRLIESVNGFIILDLHNLYCQTHNFDIEFNTLINHYPLEKVREIHISGGSWEPAVSKPSGRIRRDTHDDAVPEAVFHFLDRALPLCPNLKFVVLEQLGTGLTTTLTREQFQRDFYLMDSILQKHNLENSGGHINDFLPKGPLEYSGKPVEDFTLNNQQLQLSHILENATTVAEAIGLLRSSALAHTDWNIELWDESMLETAIKIAQKWKNGFH